MKIEDLKNLPTETLNTVVKLQDARRYRGTENEEGKEGCVAGWRYFIESHGYIWKDVVINGLTIQQLLSTDDIMATSLVLFVLEEKETSDV